MNYMGTVSGRDEDKIAKCGLTERDRGRRAGIRGEPDYAHLSETVRRAHGREFFL